VTLRSARRAVLVLPACVALAGGPAAAAELSPETVAAWDRYVAVAAELLRGAAPAEPEGTMLDVPAGTIHHWRASTVVRSTTVDHVVQALIDRGIPPPQEDVLESRMISRAGTSLRVYLKLRRSAIVTVVYDTEHDVAFHRHSAGLATSRSVARRITETGGCDRGFLWRLNSYWRYTQVGADVRIDVDSISLSRAMPWGVRPIVGPIVSRIARESLVRTLVSVRRFLERT
jgi:hypothetical protein